MNPLSELLTGRVPVPALNIAMVPIPKEFPRRAGARGCLADRQLESWLPKHRSLIGRCAAPLEGLLQCFRRVPRSLRSHLVSRRQVAGRSSSMDGSAFHDEDLNEILREFDEAIMDFHRGPSQYEEYLEQMKRRNAPSVCDSGIDESESASSSPGSSLNGSEENLTTQPVPSAPKAKLGDTRELEDFIADLDKVLEGM